MNKYKEILRVVLAISIIVVGVTHFVVPEEYAKIVPPQLPYPLGLVYLSGFYEILGGIGLLVPPVSQAAAWGLLALFIAVYPANINMAVNLIKIEHIPNSPWVHVVRLPLQAVLIAWAWWYTKSSDWERQASIIPKSLIPKELKLR
ncbi:DoxX family protein [Nostoc sp. UCD121]|uniref:DoxX family protein n=1 Tax=unclassified Nostoc TaxID=2593658 RepID=UPI0016282B0C|nr:MULTISPECIES: DoxX family protein [unclassified Nostoc]MBC1221264.1 DoxX family protein [Nostoc sp. UCD120]MBC1278343.1 DoxX family protein [Nostoc sp. UCD121]MBC1297016.1 DoxX family protein [Nostoc sp. UCD122]